MKLKGYIWIVLVLVVHDGAQSLDSQFQNDNEYFDFDPEVDDDAISLNANEGPKKLFLSNLPQSAIMNLIDPPEQPQPTDCITTEAPPPPPPEEPPPAEQPPPPPPPPPTAAPGSDDQEQKAKELRNLVQHLYIAQARVQLEASEIKKAQAVANTAQQALEEAANHVRAVTAALQNAQQEVASAAIRAQTAQLQLAAHDQLLFAARQDVDALSSQMVGLQAAEGISQPKITVDLSGLIEKLKQPLQEVEKPTAVPAIIQMPTPAKRIYQMQQRIHPQQLQQQQQQQQKRMMPEVQNFYYE